MKLTNVTDHGGIENGLISHCQFELHVSTVVER